MQNIENEIHLQDLIYDLKDCYILFDKIYLNDLFIKLSGMKNPLRNKKFSESIYFKFNKKERFSPGLVALFRYRQSIKCKRLLALNNKYKLN
jgi:hypothetical protein